MDGAGESDIALVCRGLVKRYTDVVAVNGVDLEVKRGECFGLLGPNGAGKTTTIEILEGLTPYDAGEVSVLGGKPVDERVRAKMGIALQETQLPEKLTVVEVVRVFRSFYREGRGVDEVIKHLELDEKRNARVAKLSGGQRQRLALACALVGDPAVLFLDEPTTGLDPQARLKVWELVLDFKARGGTVLLTTHYMEEAARLCDRIGILDHGKRIALGTPTELIASLGAPHVVELIAPGLRVDEIGRALPAILACAREKNATIKHLVTREATLEDVFVHLTGTGLRDE